VGLSQPNPQAFNGTSHLRAYPSSKLPMLKDALLFLSRKRRYGTYALFYVHCLWLNHYLIVMFLQIAVFGAGGYLGAVVFGFLQRASTL
jgi:hypothetical protein